MKSVYCVEKVLPSTFLKYYSPVHISYEIFIFIFILLQYIFVSNFTSLFLSYIDKQPSQYILHYQQVTFQVHRLYVKGAGLHISYVKLTPPPHGLYVEIYPKHISYEKVTPSTSALIKGTPSIIIFNRKRLLSSTKALCKRYNQYSNYEKVTPSVHRLYMNGTPTTYFA